MVLSGFLPMPCARAVFAAHSGGVSLRAYKAADFDRLQAHFDEMARYLNEGQGARFKDACLHSARDIFMRRMQWNKAGSAWGLGIFDAGEDGAWLGDMSVWATHIGRKQYSVGYFVAPQARGQGVATCALGQVVRAAFAHTGVRELKADVFSDNAASRAVLERCGFKKDPPEGAQTGLLRYRLMRY